MNWRYDNPIYNGYYVCCVKNYSFPFSLYWDKERGGWGHNKYDDRLGEWNQFDNSSVVCYISFHEIPMPEGW